jgi:histidyl-tRNA synthetase
LEKVKEELLQKGLSVNEISIVESYLSISGTNEEKIAKAKGLLGSTHSGKNGIEELDTILTYPLAARHSTLTVDLTLARGLNYYTGIIFEVKAKNVQIGSIGGGGRYDDLTGLFGVSDIPGVGISFGVDRIYDVMEELKLFPEGVYTGSQVLFFNLGEKEGRKAFVLAQQLRVKNIRCEVYHESAKFEKQFKYAEKKKIPFVIIIGDDEIKNNTCKVKNIVTGEQKEVPINELSEFAFS